MSITKFGEFMRILRIKKNILMKDTADSLNVKTPFLSAVENGKRRYLMIGIQEYVLFTIYLMMRKMNLKKQ